jgi:ABC-type Fe3+-siderophore transport system permease subunit
MMFLSGDRLAAVVSWLLGSLAGASWPRLALAAPSSWSASRCSSFAGGD